MTDVAVRIPRTSFVGKLARLPLRLVPKGSVMRVLSGPLRGAKWVVGAGVHGCWLGIYESDKQQTFVAHVKPGMTVFDIGAHVGFYTLLSARLVDKSGRVFAFEPSPRNLPKLKEHVHLNRGDNITVLECAVADAHGEMGFDIPALNADQGYMGRISENGSVRVPVETIDGLIAAGTIAPAQVVKMDVEGAELKALQGGREFFTTHHPTIFLATHGAQVHQDCCNLLRDWGFGLSSLTPGQPLEATDEVLAVYPRA